MTDAYWRRQAADQLAKDKAEWFGADWEAKQDAKDDKSNQACRDDEFPEIFQKLEDKGFLQQSHTFYPGGGYCGDGVAEQAVFRQQLVDVIIDWNRPSTGRCLDIGPRNEWALEHEGFAASEVAARFPGESFELGGESDVEQTIVAAPRSQTTKQPTGSTSKLAQRQKKEIVVEERVDEHGDVEMEDVESSVEDDAEDDSDFDPLVSERGKKRRL